MRLSGTVKYTVARAKKMVASLPAIPTQSQLMILFKSKKLAITKLQAEQVIDKLKIDGYDKIIKDSAKKVVKKSSELPVRAESTATIPNNQPMKQTANHGV